MSNFRAYLESMEPSPTVQAATDLYDNTPEQKPVVQEPTAQDIVTAVSHNQFPLDDKQINDLCCELESIWKRRRQFAPLVRYMRQSGLPYIAAGSSRMVFKLNDQKVLKLAKNLKGIDQNETEADYVLNQTEGIAEWYGVSNDGIWIVSEFCQKARQSDFKRLLGISFADYVNYVNYIVKERSGNQRTWWIHATRPENFEEYAEAENLLGGINYYIGNWDPPPGDLCRISSYGINTKGELVLVDAGLSNSVYETHYNKRRF